MKEESPWGGRIVRFGVLKQMSWKDRGCESGMYSAGFRVTLWNICLK